MTNFVKQISLCFLLALFFTGCQNKKGTTSILKEAEALMYTRPDSALQMLETISQPEQLMGQEQADYALLLTQARSRNRITAISDSLIRIAADYYQDSNDNARKAKAFLYLGDVYMDMNKYTEAIVPLKQAEEVVKDAEFRIQSLVYSNLGYLNRKSGDYKLAWTYYRKALDINKSIDNADWVVTSLINILNLPLSEIQDSAIHYVTLLEETIRTVNADLQAKAYNNIGVYYEDMQQKELAVTYYQKAIRTSISVPYRAYTNLARIYDEQGDTARADSLFQTALQTPIWSTKTNIYEALSKRYLNTGNYPEAITALKYYQAAADSFYTYRQAQEIQKLQTKYDYEVLVREKAENENRLYRILLGGIGLFFTVSIAVYWLYIQRKKNLKQIQECIAQIELLTSEKNNVKVEIKKLNQILSQGGALRDKVMQAKGEWTSLDDIRALGLYTRLRQNLQYYNPSSDYDALLHWVNITSSCFASRIMEKYPHLSTTEVTLCCLTRMGYSNAQITAILHVKQTSASRYIYRTCSSLGLPGNKESFLNFVLSF
ncbi:MAG: tetratricopeptide repeat protein [Bacteroidaceae bacterium]|nr:tetratricopeptide repeat protein [Bacteroidaceae bacterium]